MTAKTEDKKSNSIQMSVDPVVAQKMEEFIDRWIDQKHYHGLLYR